MIHHALPSLLGDACDPRSLVGLAAADVRTVGVEHDGPVPAPDAHTVRRPRGEEPLGHERPQLLGAPGGDRLGDVGRRQRWCEDLLNGALRRGGGGGLRALPGGVREHEREEHTRAEEGGDGGPDGSLIATDLDPDHRSPLRTRDFTPDIGRRGVRA